MNWLTHPELDRFDAILCSSPAAADEFERHFAGPVHVLPIGVDLELFQPDPGATRHRVGVVSTVNQWGRERDVYRALRSMPIDFPLRIHGQPAGLPSELARYDRGPCISSSFPRVYWGAQCRVGRLQSHHCRMGRGEQPRVRSDRRRCPAGDELEPGDSIRWACPTCRPTPSSGGIEPARRSSCSAIPMGCGPLVEKLGAVVRERHSFETRAARSRRRSSPTID